MSVGPLGGILGSAAGAPLSQSQGASAERAGRDAAAQERGVELDLKAERASGVGQTEGDQESSDRDADGRRMWERAPDKETDEQGAGENADESPDDDTPDHDTPGGTLDLVG